MNSSRLKLASDMLAAYIEAIKASGEFERWHYIPEVEDVAQELSDACRPTLWLDAFDEYDACDSFAGLPVEFFNPGRNFA